MAQNTDPPIVEIIIDRKINRLKNPAGLVGVGGSSCILQQIAPALFPVHSGITLESVSLCSPPLAFPLSVHKTYPMRETPPEEEKPNRNGFGLKPKPVTRPTPQPKPAPRKHHERVPRDRKDAGSHKPAGPSKPAKKSDNACCGCLVIIVLIGLALVFFI
jgi:hypothetical protein